MKSIQKNCSLISLYLLCLLSASANVPSTSKETSPSPADRPKRITAEVMVLKAISALEQHPTSNDILGILGVITTFAQKSDKVTVILDQQFFPWTYGVSNWTKDEKTFRENSLLIGAFIAGNVKPQLQKGENRDHPFEGLKFMLAMYKAWQKADMIGRIAVLDEWLMLDDKQLQDIVNKKINTL